MQWKSDLMNLIAKQIELLKDLDYSDWVARLEASQNRLRDERFNILFAGDYSRGKSTLLNALLGKEVLAVSAVPLSTVNRIERSDRPFAKIQGADGQQQSVAISALLEADYSQVTVGYPLLWLPGDVTLIEQPTLEQQSTFAEAVAQTDRVIVVVASDALYSMNEQQAVEQIKEAGHQALLFVCSFRDRIPLAEQAKLQEAAYVRLPVNSEKIFFLSAEKALQGDPQELIALEKFKEALLSGVGTMGQILKQERARRLLQQSILLAKEAILEQQRVHYQTQEAFQAKGRELQLIYEDTAALGRNLEEDLSDFRQRTGQVVQAMTNTFIRNLAQETAYWIETQDTSLSKITIEKQIRSIVGRWQQNELEPYLQKQMFSQEKDIQTQSHEFNRQLNVLYQQLRKAKSAAALTLDWGDLSIEEINLKMNDLPPVNADESSSELLNPSRIVISLAVVAATLLVIRPFFIAIPASLAGLGAANFFNMNRSKFRQSSNRRQLAQAYEQAIRQQADPFSLQILNTINVKLDELQKMLRSHLSNRLKPVKQYLQASSTKPSEAEETDYQRRLQEIEQAFRQMFST